MSVTVLVGTVKGAFLARSPDRQDWKIEGPLFKGWKLTSALAHGGSTYVATASDVYGPAVHVSEDLASWRQLERGPAWPKDGGRKLNQIWTLASDGRRILAGVDEAGLFTSEDDGESWSPVDGLNEHPTRKGWYPGFGGLCLHAILAHPRAPGRLWAGISAVGVFRSDDGGLSWSARNEGVPAVIEDRDHAEIGRCVHALVQDPDDPDLIWRREHRGMFRSRDGGDSWESIEKGLPSWFGFPAVIDPASRALYVVPLESDEYRIPENGRLAVYRSTDQGDSWSRLDQGLPERSYAGVLRSALAVDGLSPCGVYLGTTAGSLFLSADGGERWRELPATLPRILTVRVL